MFTAAFHRSFRYCALALIFAGSVFAQSEEHSATVGIAGGLTTVVGHDAGRLDHGGNIQVSGGYFFTHNLGITAAFQFSNLGITGSELARLNEPDGSARAYTLTFDPTVRFSLGHGMTGYLLGGGGYLRRTVEFTQPVLAQTVIFDPWWGFFGGGGCFSSSPCRVHPARPGADCDLRSMVGLFWSRAGSRESGPRFRD